MTLRNFKPTLPNIIVPVIALLLLTFVGVGLIMTHAVNILDDQYNKARIKSVEAVLKMQTEKVAESLASYAYWDDSVEHFILKYDPKWAKDVIGDIVPEQQSIEYILVYNPQGKIIYTYPDKITDQILLDNAKYAVDNLHETMHYNPQRVFTAVNLSQDRKVEVLAATFIRGHEKNYPDFAEQGIMVFVNKVQDDEEVATLEEQMWVSDLRVENYAPSNTPSIRLRNPNQDTIGYLTWTHVPLSRELLRVTAIPVTIGFILIMLAGYIILTRSRRAITGLVESEANIRYMAAGIDAANAPIAIISTVDQTYPFIYINPAFRALTGYHFDEIHRASLDILNGFATAPEVPQIWREAIRNLQSAKYESLYYRKDKSSFWGEINLSPIFDQRNSMIGYVLQMRDISIERREHDVKIHRDKMLSLGQMVGGVAHEINNLMQPALTFSQITMNKLPEGDLENRDHLNNVVDCCRRVIAIIKNMMTFSRQGETTLTAQPLGPLVLRDLAVVRELMPQTLTIIDDNLSLYQIPVKVNECQVAQLLSNILLNSVWATDRTGTVKISLETKAVAGNQADSMLLSPGNYAVLTIADDGVGMDDATMARIFEPFFSARPIGQGVGLGLSIVYSIVKTWHGAIKVTSAPGQGARFDIYIPVET